MFTRLSNFTYGNFRISNIDTEAVNNNFELLVHIGKYEVECLKMILGECMYSDLVSNLEPASDGYYKLKDNADEKWVWLVNGKSYTADNDTNCGCLHINCKKHHWDGLVRTVATIQDKNIVETIMASYIFFNWSLNYRTLNLGIGEGRGNAENTTQESTANKRIDAWNKLVQDVVYGYPNKVSLYQFLDDHRDIYPDLQKSCLKTMTYYDL